MGEKRLKRIAIIKVGYIGTTTLFDALLDERASRTDLEMFVVSTGTKLSKPFIEQMLNRVNLDDFDCYVVISPNATLEGPTFARMYLKKFNKPIVVISDGPTRKIKDKLAEEGFGYLIVDTDPLIGAKKAFLDPTEMAWFNGFVIAVLAGTGVFKTLQDEIDKMLDSLKKTENESPYLPRKIITATNAPEALQLSNPYAHSKLIAAGKILELIASLNVDALYKTKNNEKAILKASAAHELLNSALKLTYEARELQKAKDELIRFPHSKEGEVLQKITLLENI